MSLADSKQVARFVRLTQVNKAFSERVLIF